MNVFDLVKQLKSYLFWKKGDNVIEGHTIPTVCGTQDLGTADAGDGEPRAFRNIYAGGYYTVNCATGDVTPFSGGGGGGKPYSTRVVAASNSTASGASGADFVCTGTNDEVTLNAAINSFAGPGEVILLEGTYNTVAEIFTKDHLSLRGMGMGTKINGTPGSIGDSTIRTPGSGGNSHYASVSDMYIENLGGRPAINISGDYCVAKGVHAYVRNATHSIQLSV